MCEVAEALTTKEVVNVFRRRVMEVTVGLAGVFLATVAKSPKARLAEADSLLDEAVELASLKKNLDDLELAAEKVEERKAAVAAFASRNDRQK